MPQTLLAPGLTTGHAPFVEEAQSRGDLYITQPYELYSQENHEAWRALYSRIRPRWERYANDHFLHGIEEMVVCVTFPSGPDSGVERSPCFMVFLRIQLVRLCNIKIAA